MRFPLVTWLAAALLFAAVVFFSCRERLLVRTTPQMNAEQRFWVRVLLADDVNHCTLRIRAGFSVLVGDSPDSQTVFPHPGGPMQVSVSDAGLSIGQRYFPAGELTVVPDDPHIFALDGNDYRGKLVIRSSADGQTFDAINLLPLEPYLAGVVGAEMPRYWHIEALKAQAIAARTYCLYNKQKYGGRRNWDVMKTAASQVYLGIRAESQRVWKAVNDTYGLVLVCPQIDREEIFPTYYGSACGGHTENAENVFGDSFAPLSGVECPYCTDVAKPNVFFWPAAQFDKAAVSAAMERKYPKLKLLGGITGIVPARQSDYPEFSRLTMIKLAGPAGASDFVRAEDLRLTIDPTGSRLRSTSCKIITMDDKWTFLAGRGFGHGVGMCQCGAEGMARCGYSANEILSHYYPGSKLVRCY